VGGVLEGFEDGNKLFLLVVVHPHVFECGVARVVAALEGALELEEVGLLALQHTVNLRLGLLEPLVVTVLSSGANAGLELIEQLRGG